MKKQFNLIFAMLIFAAFGLHSNAQAEKNRPHDLQRKFLLKCDLKKYTDGGILRSFITYKKVHTKKTAGDCEIGSSGLIARCEYEMEIDGIRISYSNEVTQYKVGPSDVSSGSIWLSLGAGTSVFIDTEFSLYKKEQELLKLNFSSPRTEANLISCSLIR